MMRVINMFLVAVFVMGMSVSAGAHEKRTVADKYQFVVGFIHEPPFSGQMNGVDIRISENSKPVVGLEKTLRVKVLGSDQEGSLDLELRAVYNEEGKYSAHFLPTRPGKYIFVVVGEINGTAINERFESGEKFHDVLDVKDVSFPKSN